MKDSGIKWIREIPKSWEVIKVKYTAIDKNSIFIDGDWIESEHIKEEGIRYLTSGNVGVGVFKEQGHGYISEESFRTLKCLEVFPGDLMISRLNKPLGRSCIVPRNEKKYVVAVDNVILRPNKNVDKYFLNYVMNTDEYAKEAALVSRGATMQRISRSILGELWVTLPPHSEQKTIVSYLDYQCSKIDSLIEKLESQLSLLNSYKESLISESVTKGLDLTKLKKDSGIEWIGKIPTDWRLSKIKYSVETIGSGSTPDSSNYLYYDGDNNWIQSSDLYNTDVIRSTMKTITNLAVSEASSLTLYKAPFIVIAMYGASIGNVALSKIDSYTNQACCVLKNNEVMDLNYLYYYLAFAKNQLVQLGVGGTQPNISQILIKNFDVTVPPIKEQKRISIFLHERCTELESITTQKEKQLELIKRHKNSLIYEFVTGKKRVRGYKNGN